MCLSSILFITTSELFPHCPGYVEVFTINEIRFYRIGIWMRCLEYFGSLLRRVYEYVCFE